MAMVPTHTQRAFLISEVLSSIESSLLDTCGKQSSQGFYARLSIGAKEELINPERSSEAWKERSPRENKFRGVKTGHHRKVAYLPRDRGAELACWGPQNSGNLLYIPCSAQGLEPWSPTASRLPRPPDWPFRCSCLQGQAPIRKVLRWSGRCEAAEAAIKNCRSCGLGGDSLRRGKRKEASGTTAS